MIEWFGLLQPTSLHINMKNYIRCTEFVNVNIAVNLHSYKEKFYIGVH